MPIKGFRATHCKRGHELTPENRKPTTPTGRGGGECRLCDELRRPRSADHQARREARSAQRKRCPQCGQAKGWEAFSRDSSAPDGLRGWCKACVAHHRRGGAEAAVRYVWVARLRNQFGLTEEQYDAMLAEQGGVCAICKGANRTGKKLAVDHCHGCGQVRGILCGRCNSGIGMLRDSLDLVRNAAVYLEGRPCQVESVSSAQPQGVVS